MKRSDYTMPRTRLAAGTDPTDAINSLYQTRQLDKTNTKTNKYGELVGGPTAPKSYPDEHKPQFKTDQHDPSYDNATPSDWRRGMGAGQAEGRPGFDRSKPSKAGSNPNRATGSDCERSPFSSANRTTHRESK